MSYYRTSIGFARLNDSKLGAFVENVIAKMTGNPAFPTPLVSMADLKVAADTYNNAVAESINGGRLATAKKNAARDTLLGLLRQEAAYVESIAGNDLPT